jgi:TRAP-type C4-dicarboxylate transport system permease small subunit
MMSTLGIHKAWLYCSVPINGLFIVLFNIKILKDTLSATDAGSEKAEVLS